MVKPLPCPPSSPYCDQYQLRAAFGQRVSASTGWGCEQRLSSGRHQRPRVIGRDSGFLERCRSNAVERARTKRRPLRGVRGRPRLVLTRRGAGATGPVSVVVARLFRGLCRRVRTGKIFFFFAIAGVFLVVVYDTSYFEVWYICGQQYSLVWGSPSHTLTRTLLVRQSSSNFISDLHCFTNERVRK